LNQFVESWTIRRSARGNLQALPGTGESEELGENVELSRYIAAEDVTRSKRGRQDCENESQEYANLSDKNAEGC